MNRKLQTLKYLFADWLSAAVGWSMFFYYRKTFVESKIFGYRVMVNMDERFLQGLLLIPIFWLVFYIVLGRYRRIYRKSRLTEVVQTFGTTLIGVTAIFFTLILDDEVLNHTTYYKSYAVLFSLHFLLTFTGRFLLSSITARRIKKRIIGFPTIMVGSDAKALELFDELQDQKRSAGQVFEGFIRVRERESYPMADRLPFLGTLDEMPNAIRKHGIEEVIIALESSEHESLQRILNRIENDDIVVKVIPDMYDIISGSVKMDSIYGVPLIQITKDVMPPWQHSNHSSPKAA